jgi:hypothetical protein
MRIAIYHAANRFVGKVITDIDVEREWLSEFSRETDEAVFLFGTEVAEYLRELYQNAVKLRSISQKMARPGPDPALAELDAEMFLYFEGRFDRWRQLLEPYLRLA